MSVVECVRVSASAATTLTLASPANAQSIQHSSHASRLQNASRFPETETLSPIRVNALATLWRGLAALLASCSSAG